MSKYIWTEESINTLKLLWDDILPPMSTRKIAEALGTNKNSVLGKAFRLGLKKKASIGKGANDSIFRGDTKWYHRYRRNKNRKIESKKIIQRKSNGYFDILYHFEHQRKGNTRKSIKGRFAQGDKAKSFWAKNRDNYSDKESSKATRNEKLGFRKLTRAISKINTTHEIVDVKDYVMPIYKNDFIKIKSFIPRDSNRLKYKMKIHPNVRSITGTILYNKEYKTVFDNYLSAKNYAVKLEKQHVEYTKKQYEDYYSTNKYN